MMNQINHSSVRPASRLFGVLVLLALMTQASLAQTEEDALRFSLRAPATGARMMGMAGAGVGGVADWTALYYNPAALGFMRSSELSGSLNFFKAGSDATYTLPGGDTDLESASVSRTHLTNLGYVYKVPTAVGSLAFGIGYSQVRAFDRQLSFTGRNGRNSITDYFMPLPGEFDVTQDEGDDGIFDTADDIFSVDFYRDLSYFAYETYAIDFDRDLWYGGDDVPFLPAVTYGTVEQHGEVFEEGGISELSFGGAVEAAPRVMVGASANFTFGSYTFERVFEESDVLNDNDGVNNGTTDFDFLRLSEYLDTDVFGVNLRGGLSAQVTPIVRLGLTVETPTYLEMDESFGTTLVTEFDNGDSYDFTDEVPSSGKYKIISPWRFGGGATLTLNGLTLSGDAELVNWSEMRFDAGNTGNEDYFDELNRVIRSDFDSSVNLRVGGEYSMGPASLRLGYALQPYPYDLDDGVNRDRTYFSAGIGIAAGDQMEVNLGFMREQFEDRYLPYSGVQGGDPFVTEDVVRDRVLLGVKFRF